MCAEELSRRLLMIEEDDERGDVSAIESEELMSLRQDELMDGTSGEGLYGAGLYGTRASMVRGLVPRGKRAWGEPCRVVESDDEDESGYESERCPVGVLQGVT